MGVVKRSVPAQGPWFVRGPAAEKVEYHGAVSYEQAAGSAHGVLYPAPNLIGFLAAVAVHGAISNSLQDKRRAEIREAADKVLVPYQPLLDTMLHANLLPQALAQVSGGGSKTLVPADQGTGQWLIETMPVYAMTQDQRALVLDNAFIVRSPDAESPVVYQNVVRVVAKPIPPGDEQSPVSAAWLAEEGRRLREQSAQLLAESFDLLFADLARGPAPTQEVQHKTVRYLEGGNVRMERAAPMVERCDRVVLRTLRGWVMSVPRQPRPGEECAEPVVDTKSIASAAP